jgi:hypothetical protein
MAPLGAILSVVEKLVEYLGGCDYSPATVISATLTVGPVTGSSIT